MTSYTFTATVTENTPGGFSAVASQPFTVSGAGTTGLVGATTILNGYPAYSDRLTLANYINTQVEGNPATTIQKWFLQDWISKTAVGSGTNQIPTGLAELITAGCQIILCTSPVTSTDYGGSGDPSVADYASLGTTLDILQTYGAENIWCVPQQEPNGGSKFASAAAYGSYANYYIPAIRAQGVPVVIDVATNHSTAGNYQAYFQAVTAQVDILLADYYGNTWYPSNGNPQYLLDQPFGDATQALTVLANKYSYGPIPFGLGEWGVAQQGSAGLPATGTGSWQQFYEYVIGLFTSRTASGKQNSCVCWFSGVNSPEYNTIPDGPGYDITAGLNAVYAALR